MNKQRIVVFCTLIIPIVFAEEKWKGKWFPNNPEEVPLTNNKITTSNEWKGNWFPQNPNESKNEVKSTATKESHNDLKEIHSEGTSKNPDSNIKDDQNSSNWNGKWFPEKPNEKGVYEEKNYEKDRIMGIPNSDCDDGKVNLHVDFDPSNTSHVLMYTCLESTFKPNDSLEPIETIRDVPKFYTPVHKCMNETILIPYDQHIPTLGYHRPLWPVYGEYKYLPPQRWLHSLEHGAVGMLYHPCANKSEIDKLRHLLKKCLFRHIITPYKLSNERPLGLVAWGVSLEMSSFDKTIALNFIQKYAKTGPEKVSRQGQYKEMLIEEAKIVSDEEDSQICPDVSSMM